MKISTEGSRMTKEFAFFYKVYLDIHAINSITLETFYAINGDHFGRQYKERFSDYKN